MPWTLWCALGIFQPSPRSSTYVDFFSYPREMFSALGFKVGRKIKYHMARLQGCLLLYHRADGVYFETTFPSQEAKQECAGCTALRYVLRWTHCPDQSAYIWAVQGEYSRTTSIDVPPGSARIGKHIRKCTYYSQFFQPPVRMFVCAFDIVTCDETAAVHVLRVSTVCGIHVPIRECACVVSMKTARDVVARA